MIAIVNIQVASANHQIFALSKIIPGATLGALVAPQATLNALYEEALDIDLRARYAEQLTGHRVTEAVFDGVTMVLVPAGCFQMGSENGDSNERPVHEVCFAEPFWLDKFEVTQADFERLGGVKERANGFDGDNRPVENITWFEAEAFCRERRGGRLPSEAEWEYAARGPLNWEYPWDDFFIQGLAVYTRNSNHQTAEVGEGIRTAGASWVGAHDMVGNVWEWTASVYVGYPYPTDGSREVDTGSRTDVLRVLRGGSWFDTQVFLRAAYRNDYTPDDWGYNLGVRCARSPERSEG
jgi:formylglycine-generating enzyme required for sulfatase activity